MSFPFKKMMGLFIMYFPMNESSPKEKKKHLFKLVLKVIIVIKVPNNVKHKFEHHSKCNLDIYFWCTE